MAATTTNGATTGSWLRAAGWGGAALLLLLPLLTNAPWTLSDFMFMGALMAGVGTGLELAVRRGNAAYTAGAGLALVASFLLIWINGAVGIIGSEAENGNLLFVLVPGVALIGSAAAMFRPAGMAIAMVAAAVVQLLVPFAAYALGQFAPGAIWSAKVAGITLMFVAMWLASGASFRRARRS